MVLYLAAYVDNPVTDTRVWVELSAHTWPEILGLPWWAWEEV